MKKFKDLLNEVTHELFIDDSYDRWNADLIMYGKKQGYEPVAVTGIMGKDIMLFKLNAHDKKLVKDIKLKVGEQIYRYSSKATNIGKMFPFMKFNIKRGLLYGLTQDNFDFDSGTDEIKFVTRGEKMRYTRTIKK